jgi:hypothetical protein
MLLLVALVCIDDRVREQLALRVTRPTAELAREGKRVGDLTSVVVQVAREQSAAHAPMLTFTLAAGVLVVFMLRT